MTDWRATVSERFGFSELRDGQAEVIERLLAGRNAAAIFPTGGGKSLCYQAPGVLLPGLTVVVSPLLALMKDQIDALRARGIPAARLDSTLSAEEYAEVCRDAGSGATRLLYVAPERFNNERFQQLMQRLSISLVAIDEAHCISEWGHNFRPDYLKISQHLQTFGVERVLALTATATPAVAADMATRLGIDEGDIVRTPFHRANLAIHLTPAGGRDEQERLLLARLSERERGATIVYVTLQKTAERVAGALQAAGHEARAYHAGMKDDVREEVQDWFMQSPGRIVVATIAFGMGIDKADIRYVYHFNPPKSLESYAQEIGRAGRDGAASVCEMFYCHADRRVLENFAYGDTPGRGSVEAFFDFVFSHDGVMEVGTYELSTRFDIRTLVLRTLLVYLELDGYLAAGTPIYTTSRFIPNMPSSAILAKLQGEPRDFLAKAFSFARPGRKWYALDHDDVAARLGCDRRRVARALNYAADQGWIQLQSSGVKVPFEIRRRPESVTDLAAQVWQRVEAREAAEIERMNSVEQLVTASMCQARQLSGHFGEALDADCGQCSYCRGQQAAVVPHAAPVALDEAALQAALVLQSEQMETLGDPRALARFLVGVTSPATSRRRMAGHPMFGRFTEVPFGALLERISGG